MIDDIDKLKGRISTLLCEAESEGLDRENVADLLEQLAEAVRNGHTTLPDDRGAWYQEVHGGSGADRVTADD